MTNFHNNLESYTKRNDGLQANRMLMYELGKILVKHKADFVELLNQSGIYASVQMPDLDLINKFIDSINYNKKLLIGTAFLINVHNKSIGFDGGEEVNDDSVKHAYKTMYSYFGAYDFMDASDSDFSNASSDVGAIAAALGEGAKLGSQIAQNKEKKKYGGQDLLSKKIDAKNQMIQSAIAQKQADSAAKAKAAESKSKITKIVVIATVSVVVIGLGILAYVKLKKK